MNLTDSMQQWSNAWDANYCNGWSWASVSLSATRLRCANIAVWMDGGAAWRGHCWGSKERCIRWESRFPPQIWCCFAMNWTDLPVQQCICILLQYVSNFEYISRMHVILIRCTICIACSWLMTSVRLKPTLTNVVLCLPEQKVVPKITYNLSCGTFCYPFIWKITSITTRTLNDWHSGLCQRPSLEEACSAVSVSAVVVMWRGK